MDEKDLKEIEAALNIQCSDMSWCVDTIEKLIAAIRDLQKEGW